MTTHPLITAALAQPKTHKVVTLYADDTTKQHETRSLATAENYAVLERRKIGRNLIDRATGNTVHVVSVTVSPIVQNTNGDIWKQRAEEMGMPLRTVDQVRADLANAKTAGADKAMARLMLRHGRLTDEAILYIGDNYPNVWE